MKAMMRRGMVGALGALVACGNSESTPSTPPDTAGMGGASGTGGSAVSGAGGSGVSSGAFGTNGGTAGAAAGSTGTSGGGGTSAAGAGGGAGRAGTDASGGTNGGRGGAGGSSEGGAPDSVDCTGDFGDEHSIHDSAERVTLRDLALPDDELELFFVEENTIGVLGPRIMRGARLDRDADFDAPAPVAELASVCTPEDDWTITISPDGLHLYVACYTLGGTITPGPLHLARRSGREAPFVLDEATYGTVGPNLGIARDELRLFGTSDAKIGEPGVQFSRSSLDEPFGTSSLIEGLEDVYFKAPTLAVDGTTLFGSVSPDLVASTRTAPGEPFGAPDALLSGVEDEMVFSAPEISSDCRTLYFLRTDVDAEDGSTSYSIWVAKR